VKLLELPLLVVFVEEPKIVVWLEPLPPFDSELTVKFILPLLAFTEVPVLGLLAVMVVLPPETST
jgi:hypothetical protein